MLYDKLKTTLDALMMKKIGVLMWAAGFLGVVAIRTFIKTFLVSPGYSLIGTLTDYLHEVFFFFITFALVWLFLSFILRKSPEFFSTVMFWAIWLMIFSPVLDMLRTGGGMFWSFYLLGTPKELLPEFLSFFGNLPSGIVYFGPRIMSFLIVLLSFGLVFLKTRNIIKSGLSALGAYMILFFMGAIPSFLAYAYYFFERSIKIANVSATDIMQLFSGTGRLWGVQFGDLRYVLAYNLNQIFFLFSLALFLLLVFAINRAKFFAVVKNARFAQLVYHSGLFLIGMGLGFLAYPENFNLNIFSVFAASCLLASVWLSWLASVVINDIYDFEIDKISNPERPLQKEIFTTKEYSQLGTVFFLLAVLGGMAVDIKFAGLLVVYQFLAWTYSATPYRLKRFPIIATLISAFASLIILFIGFALLSGEQNINGLSWRIILLLLISLTLSLPIKDFKDIEGDKKDGVWTIPVIFGEERSRLIVGVGVFVSFMLSVFFLNEFNLFWWAVLCGGAAFLIILNKKPRQLFWWVMAPVFAYSLILAKVVFL